MIKPVRVILTPFEKLIAERLSSARAESSNGIDRDAHGFKGDRNAIHQSGGHGEVASSVGQKLVKVVQDEKLYPYFSVNAFGQPDFGSRIQIRTRRAGKPDLIFRPGSDNPNHIFVLVTEEVESIGGIGIPAYYLWGWEYGRDIPGKDATLSDPDGRNAPAWFKHKKTLRDLSEFPKMELTSVEYPPEGSDLTKPETFIKILERKKK